LRSGRFGPYVQLGEAVEKEKPKRAGLPKGTAPEDVDLERALALLSLPREVGLHPEDGEPIRAGIGRFGPYVQHGKTYANLEPGDDIFHIGLNRAVTLIAEKLAKGPRRRFGADPGRELGVHPTKGGPIVAKNGRYGPYVSHDGVNATLPSDKTPETVTLEEAAALIDARSERSGSAPHARRRKTQRPAPGTARHIKASSKRPAPRAGKRSATDKPQRKSSQAAE
jgi:DNA topoisomerase-1